MLKFKTDLTLRRCQPFVTPHDRFCFDRDGLIEIENPDRSVGNMRKPVAQHTIAILTPTSPASGVVALVKRCCWARPLPEIPVQRRRNGAFLWRQWIARPNTEQAVHFQITVDLMDLPKYIGFHPLTHLPKAIIRMPLVAHTGD